MFRTSFSISPTPAQFAPLLFAGQWEAALAAACELGYDAVEISLRDPNDPKVMRLMEAIHSHGLALSAIATGQSYYNDGMALTSLRPDVQTTLLERLQRFVEFAAPWKATLILGGIRGKLEGDEKTRIAQRIAARVLIEKVAAFALPYGVSLALEPVNRYETNFLNTVQECLAFADEIGAVNLGVLPDTFHMNIEEISIVEALRMAGKRCLYLHFPDSNRHAPGQGHIDFYQLVDFLCNSNYSGYICAEILPLPDSHTAAAVAIRFFQKLQLFWRGKSREDNVPGGSAH